MSNVLPRSLEGYLHIENLPVLLFYKLKFIFVVDKREFCYTKQPSLDLRDSLTLSWDSI